MLRSEKRGFSRESFLAHLRSVKRTSFNSQRFTFGIVKETIFNKHQFTLKTIEFIKYYNLYASIDDKNFYLFDCNGQLKHSLSIHENLRTNGVTCFTYSNKFHLYALFTNDFRIILLNDFLEVVKSERLDIGAVLNVAHLEDRDLFICCSRTGCTVISISFDSRYPPDKALLLDPLGQQVNIELEIINSFSGGLNWIKNMLVDARENKITMWGDCDLRVYNLRTYAHMMSLDNVCEGAMITCVLSSSFHEYVAVATTLGHIYLYNLLAPCNLLHTYFGHTKIITKLCSHPNPNFFISCSLDFTVRIWSFELYSQVYCLKIPMKPNKPLTYVNLIDHMRVAYCYSANLHISRIQVLGEFFSVSKNKVKKMIALNESVIVLTDDNSVVNYSLDGKVISTIYPPPTSTDIKEVHYCHELKRFVLLLSTGAICVFRCDGKTGQLDQLIDVGSIRDVEKKAILNPVITMKFLEGEPPNYDSELYFKKRKDKSDLFKLTHMEFPHKFVAITAGKGVIIFLRIEQMTLIYGRFTLHRESIIHITELPGFIITVCQSNILNISIFNQRELLPFKSIQLYNSIDRLIHLPPLRFGIAFSKGDIDLCKLASKKLLSLSKNKQFDHEKTTFSYAVNEDKEIFATSGADCKLKLWTFDKIFIREYEFPQPVDSIEFLPNGNLITAHGDSINTMKIDIYEQTNESLIVEEEMSEDFYKEREGMIHSHRQHSSLSVISDPASPEYNYFTRNSVSPIKKGNANYEDEDMDFNEIWLKAVDFYQNPKQSNPKHYQPLTKLERSPSLIQKSKRISPVKLGQARMPDIKQVTSSRSASIIRKARPVSPTTINIQKRYHDLLKLPNPDLTPPRRSHTPSLITRHRLTEEKIIHNARDNGESDRKRLKILDEMGFLPTLSAYKKNS